MQDTDFFSRASAIFLKASKLPDRILDSVRKSENVKFRIAGLAVAAVLGILSLSMGLSLLGAVFGLKAFSPSMGAFFSQSYGILAFFVPFYLGCAAWILADPVWRPARLFTLNVSILPFLTIGIGFILMRDFEGLSQQSAMLTLVGRTGLGIITVVLTFLQVLGMQLLRDAIFPKKAAGEKRRVWRLRKQGPFLPPPEGFGTDEFTQDDFAENDLASGRQDSESYTGTSVGVDASVLGEWIGSASIQEPQPIKSYYQSRAEKSRPALPGSKPLYNLEYPVTAQAHTETSNKAIVELDDPDIDINQMPVHGSDTVNHDPADGDLSDNIFARGQIPQISFDEPEFTDDDCVKSESFIYDIEDAEIIEDDAADNGSANNSAGNSVASNSATTSDLENYDMESGDTENDDDDNDESDNAESDDEDPAEIDSVERALEEAEAAAAMHSEQVENKAKAAAKGRRPKTYNVPVEILNLYPDGEYWVIDDVTRDAAVTLKETLREFKIQAEVTGIRKGPVITMFEILPAPGVKLSRIVNLQDNIALRLAASSVRIVAPIPGKHAVGIEVPNAKRNIVSFREIIEGEMQREGKHPEIPVVMGKDITGEAQTIDLTQTPHLLIAGATGAGKSVCVNSMILSILYRMPPSDCRLILIDPKIVELKLYNDIPHLLTPVITEPKRAFQALQYCIFEMERRYACLDSMGVRDIRNYNKRIKERGVAQEKMPYIVIIIDEFADLMATTGKELESTVARLAAMSRAVGIHLVLATQRPSIDVITGLIKANIPSRIAFMVASKMDSRIIIDTAGAEKLLGKGDMLYAGVVDPFPIRMQGAYVCEEEVEAVVAHVKTLGEPDYIDDEIFFDDEEDGSDPAFLSEGDDPLYDQALNIVIAQGKASASYIQRRLKIGYNRAARLVEIMEHQGVVGPAQGSKPREVLRSV